MAQAVRGRGADATSPALHGDADWICVDCDLQQVDATATCPACGGAVVARLDWEEAEHDPLIGRKVGGRFTVMARLGAGSMGAVYRARQDGMHREVALKVLKPERAYDSASQQRFEREARATSALASPHTVTVYDFGEEDLGQGPMLYLAMERLEGESLGQRLKRVTRVAPLDAVRIAQQALRSLAEAHDKGVIHRDLKPDNIFLHLIPTPHGTEETVKVLDFGIAKILQPDLKVDSLETQAGTVFGTPRYMSPEQAQSKPLDGRSDLYTIGLILFQMVTGRHVFPDEDAVVVMARHIQSLPPRPREVAPDAGISRKLEAVILRALAKDPRRRPQTAQEFHDELEAVRHERPEPVESAVMPVAAPHETAAVSGVAVAPTPIEVGTGPTVAARRHRARTIATFTGLGILLLGAVGLGVVLAQGRGKPTVTETATGSNGKATASPKPTIDEGPTEIAPIITTGSGSVAPGAKDPPKDPGKDPAPKATGTKKTDPKPASTKDVDPPAPSVTAPPTPPPPPPTPTASASKKGGYGKFD